MAAGNPPSGAPRSAVILGGGVAGLAAGWQLARTGHWRVTVVERAPVLGGLCGTFQHEDMRLDYGPHKCFSVMPEVLGELRGLMGEELLEHRKRNRIYLFNRYLNYPVSAAQLLASMGPQNLISSGAGVVIDRMRAATGGYPRDSYEHYVVSRFGRGLYQLVFEPLADKVWGDPATLSADLARLRLPSTSAVDVLLRMLKLKRETAQTNADIFYYPKQGFGRIPERMAEEIRRYGGEILTSATPMAVHHEDGRITGITVEQDGERQRLACDWLISTIPFDALAELMQQHRREPRLDELLAAAKRLEYRHLILAYVVVDAPRLTQDHWIFFPERQVAFGRIFEQKLLSEAMVPADKTVICCDMVDGEQGARWQSSDEALGRRCVDDLRRTRILDGQPVRETFVKRSRKFYPRYDMAYRDTLARLYGRLKDFRNVVATGRIGFYNYNNSDHCVDMAMQIREALEQGMDGPAILERLESRVAAYRIVD